MTNQSTPLDKMTEYKNRMQPNRPINYMYMKYTCGMTSALLRKYFES